MYFIIGLLFTPVGFAIGYRITYLIAKAESRYRYQPTASSRFGFSTAGLFGAALFCVAYPVAIPLTLLYWALVKSKFLTKMLSKLEA